MVQLGKLTLKSEGTSNGTVWFVLEEKGPLSTKEITIDVDNEKGTVKGNILAYGSWEDLEEQEVEEYVKFLKEINKLK